MMFRSIVAAGLAMMMGLSACGASGSGSNYNSAQPAVGSCLLKATGEIAEVPCAELHEAEVVEYEINFGVDIPDPCAAGFEKAYGHPPGENGLSLREVSTVFTEGPLAGGRSMATVCLAVSDTGPRQGRFGS